MTKLDTRAARCDLTSRECCKLLCGALAGAMPLVARPETIRLFFQTLYAAAVGDADKTRRAIEALSGLDLDPHDLVAIECVSRMFGATIGAVGEQAAPGALDDAVKWIGERGDDFWAALQQGLTNDA